MMAQIIMAQKSMSILHQPATLHHYKHRAWFSSVLYFFESWGTIKDKTNQFQMLKDENLQSMKYEMLI
jgi:hypothetical protein